MRLDDFTPEDIRKAVREAVAKADDRFEAWEIHSKAAEHLGVTVSQAADFGSYAGSREWTRYTSRIGRALAELVSSGDLVKVSGGQKTPEGGAVRGRSAFYYPPEVYRQAEAKARQERAEATRAGQRWGVLTVRMNALGYPWSGEPGTLSLAQWEELARELEEDLPPSSPGAA